MELIDENVTEKVADQVETQLNFFQKLIQEIEDNALDFILQLLFAILVCFIGVIIIFFIKKIVHRSLTKLSVVRQSRGGTPFPVHFVEEIIKFALYVVLLAIIAQVFGISTASIIAVLGSSLLAIGLGFQGALSNLAGGFLLLFTRPFKVGDFIIIGSNENEGVVSKIGVVYTTLQVGDFKEITIPNGDLCNKPITNLTPHALRFVELKFPIAYGADIKKAKEIVHDIATKHEHTEKEKPITVYVSELDADSVNIGLRYYLKPQFFPATNWDITEQVKLEFDAQGISIPFRQVDVHMIP